MKHPNMYITLLTEHLFNPQFAVNFSTTESTFNTSFSRFFENSYSIDKELFIPITKARETLNIIIESFTGNIKQTVDISYSLCCDFCTKVSNIRHLFGVFTSNNNSLCKVSIKDSDYIVGRGFIFNKSWYPLLMCGLSAYFNENSKSFENVHPICYISPTIFEEPDLLSKFIIKHVIPIITTNKVTIPYIISQSPHINFSSAHFQDAEIRIKEPNQFIRFCKSPEVDNYSTDIWEFLKQDKADLLCL